MLISEDDISRVVFDPDPRTQDEHVSDQAEDRAEDLLDDVEESNEP